MAKHRDKKEEQINNRPVQPVEKVDRTSTEETTNEVFEMDTKTIFKEKKEFKSRKVSKAWGSK